MTDSNSPQQQLKQIYDLIRQDKRREASQLLKQFLKNNPQSADGYYFAAFLSSDPERKIKLCERALKLDPAHLQARKLLDSLRSEAVESSAEPGEGETAGVVETGLVPYRSPALAVVSQDKYVEIHDAQARPIELVGQVKPRSNNNSLILVLATAAVVLIVVIAAAVIVASPRRPLPTTTVAAPVVVIVTATPLPATDTPLPTDTPWPTSTPRTAVPRPRTTLRPIVSETRYIPGTLFTRSPTPTTPPATATRNPFIAPRLNAVVKPFAYDIVDAEYSNSLDRIISVSDNPSAVHIYDPEANTETTVQLSRPPTCISVSADGLFAAVGQDAMITYIDLKQATIVKTFETSVRAYDIVLGNNGWAYVMALSSSDALHAVQLDTGNEIVLPGAAFSRSIIKRDSDGSSFYYLDHDDSPEIMGHIIPPAADQAIRELDWPYHGDFSHCGNMWLSADGSQMFSECGNIFRSSTDPAPDMKYDGVLSDVGWVFGVADAPSAKKLVAIVGPDKGSDYPWQGDNHSSPLINLFDELTHNRTSKFILPAFADGKQSAGTFVFTNASGSHFYVLVRDYVPIVPHSSTSPTPPGVEFGIVTADINASQATDGLADISTPLQIPATATPDVEMTGLTPPIPALNFSVTGAAYSAPLDRIIMISTDPANALYIYSPANGVKQTVPLSQEPKSVGVAPDGLYAVVAHDSAVTLVDLKGAKAIKTYAMNAQISQAVLALNGWIYALSVGTQSPVILGLNVKTGTVSTAGAASQEYGTLHIHPDGQRLYLMDSNAIYRLNIGQDGSLSSPYTWYYDGLSDYCGAAWFSQDGLRLMNACGSLLRIAADPKQDTAYAGVLIQNTYVLDHFVYDGLADSSTSKVILALPGVDQNPDPVNDPLPKQKVLVFGTDSLQNFSGIELPELISPNSSIPGIGKYIFVNAKGNRFYVIMEAIPGSILLPYDFGVWSAPVPSAK